MTGAVTAMVTAVGVAETARDERSTAPRTKRAATPGTSGNGIALTDGETSPTVTVATIQAA